MKFYEFSPYINAQSFSCVLEVLCSSCVLSKNCHRFAQDVNADSSIIAVDSGLLLTLNLKLNASYLALENLKKNVHLLSVRYRKRSQEILSIVLVVQLNSLSLGRLP
jgi:hypothetical protein